jgi:hypothetical protein
MGSSFALRRVERASHIILTTIAVVRTRSFRTEVLRDDVREILPNPGKWPSPIRLLSLLYWVDLVGGQIAPDFLLTIRPQDFNPVDAFSAAETKVNPEITL